MREMEQRIHLSDHLCQLQEPEHRRRDTHIQLDPTFRDLRFRRRIGGTLHRARLALLVHLGGHFAVPRGRQGVGVAPFLVPVVRGPRELDHFGAGDVFFVARGGEVEEFDLLRGVELGFELAVSDQLSP
jgi:hypothetical protein